MYFLQNGKYLMENNQYEKHPTYDDEISLVDLAAMFLKHRRIFYVVFLVIMLAGVAYAVLASEKYSYVSLVKLAEAGSDKYIDKPAAVIASLENRWVPEFEATYMAKHDSNLPFDIVLANPENTGLIRIASEASPDENKSVQRFHQQLLSQLESGQAAAVAQLRQGLNKRIQTLDSTVDMLKGTKDAGAAIAAAIEQRVKLEADLESVEPVKVLVVARESAKPKGPARSLIVVLAALLGLMTGIFAAFFAEFICSVKSQMAEE